jgi:hypothetical protein
LFGYSLLVVSFGAAVAEQQKRPSLAYDSKIYERHEVRTNKVSLCSCCLDTRLKNPFLSHSQLCEIII